MLMFVHKHIGMYTLCIFIYMPPTSHTYTHTACGSQCDLGTCLSRDRGMGIPSSLRSCDQQDSSRSSA